MHKTTLVFLAACCLLAVQACAQGGKKDFRVSDEGQVLRVESAQYTMTIEKSSFSYGFQNPEGEEIAAAHPEAGLWLARAGSEPKAVSSSRFIDQKENHLLFEVETAGGITADVKLWLQPHAVKMEVYPREEGRYAIVAGTKGVGPVYGLGDHGARNNQGEPERTRTELTGFNADTLRGDRMISNFAIFPKQGFAEVNMEPGLKTVRLTEEENVQGSLDVSGMPAFYYFFGSPEEIYEAYLDARNAEGYKVYKPKYAWFGVGWEAFGALAWNTNEESVTKNIDQYLELGFPLEWMVVGSGFWPSGSGEFDKHGSPYGSEAESEEAKKLQATTSFGLWDHAKYPDPKKMIDHFHDKGLLFTIGLRIGFIPGGPFTDEGLEKGYYLTENGEARLFEISFPRTPVYLLDTYQPEAVEWYVELCKKWLDYGVDGFKEDLFGYPQTILPDDLLDPVNEALMDEGVYVMGRNAYLGSPADIHRYNDFNYNQLQDRGPINGLAYAYSGFPNVYPDIIGGTGLATGRFGDEPESKLRMYLMRYAQYAALHPSFSFGYGPWNFDDEVTRVCLEAALLHDRLQPYMYSNAIRAYETGFPYPMTPLPLAYPNDPEVYHLADTTRRIYQWLIGESLLATPLYGDDYAIANSRDVYLPEGTWIEYDSGEKHVGPLLLEDYPLPVGKTPLFVGGKGIVVEEIDGQLMARVYPVNNEASMTFYDSEGKAQNNISLENPDWEQITVTDETTGEEITAKLERHAWTFPLAAGRDYTIR